MKLRKRVATAALVGVLAFTATGLSAIQNSPAIVEAATTATNSPNIIVSYKDVTEDTIEVSLGFGSQRVDKFSYALVYDTSAVEVVSANWNGTFLDVCQAIADDVDDSTQPEGFLYLHQDFPEKGYVAFAGAYANGKDENNVDLPFPVYKGQFATVTLKKLADVDNFGSIKVIKNVDGRTDEEFLADAPANLVDLVNGYVRGDVDGNGKIETKDAILVLKMLAGVVDLEEGSKAYEAALVDANDKIETRDAIAILKKLAGMSDDDWNALRP